MAENRRKAMGGLAALVAFSLFVCSVTGGALARAPRGQINFTPNIPPLQMTQTAQALAIATASVATPTLGPGQSFEEDDPSRPEVILLAGDPRFGYGALASDPDLYVIWVTDEAGTHYLIVGQDSDLISGDGTQQGLDSLIAQRTSLLIQIARLVRESENQDNTSGTLFDMGIGGLILAGVCVVASMGACGVIVGAAGAFLVPAFMIQGDARGNDAQVQVLAAQLHDLEDLIRNRFALGLAQMGTP